MVFNHFAQLDGDARECFYAINTFVVDCLMPKNPTPRIALFVRWFVRPLVTKSQPHHRLCVSHTA